MLKWKLKNGRSCSLHLNIKSLQDQSALDRSGCIQLCGIYITKCSLKWSGGEGSLTCALPESQSKEERLGTQPLLSAQPTTQRVCQICLASGVSNRELTLSPWRWAPKEGQSPWIIGLWGYNGGIRLVDIQIHTGQLDLLVCQGPLVSIYHSHPTLN